MFGAISSMLTEFERKRVCQLLLLNAFRGMDGTGLMFQPKGPEKIKFFNTTTHPWEFAAGKLTELENNVWKKHPVSMIAGHTRLATIGKVHRLNQHPFYHGAILGMHNGTIKKEFTNHEKFQTDSEALIYNISKFGIKEALKIVKDADPAYAIVYVDHAKSDKTLNFVRNYLRPLHFMKMHQTMYWSSEKEHLKTLGVDSYYPVEEFQPNKLYTMSLTDIDKLEFEITDVHPFVERIYPAPNRPFYVKDETSEKPLPFYAIPKTYSEWKGRLVHLKSLGENFYSQGHSEFDVDFGKYYTPWQKGEIIAAREKISAFGPSTGAVVPFVKPEPKVKQVIPRTDFREDDSETGLFETVPNRFVPRDQYLSRLNAGCQSCGLPAYEDDLVCFTEPGEYLCETCLWDMKDKALWLWECGFSDAVKERIIEKIEEIQDEMEQSGESEDEISEISEPPARFNDNLPRMLQ